MIIIMNICRLADSGTDIGISIARLLFHLIKNLGLNFFLVLVLILILIFGLFELINKISRKLLTVIL